MAGSLLEKVLAGKVVSTSEVGRQRMFSEQGPGIRKGLSDVAKGAAVAPFTLAPDIMGQFGDGAANPYNGETLSGDPIRELVGLDPNSGFGVLGEFFDPSGAFTKAAKVAKAFASSPELAELVTNPGSALAMTLFHGTPHKFKKFKMDAIGTGEGAQAYGHGLYFAESPGVAGSYQKALSGTVNDLDDTLAKNFEFKGKTFSTDMPHSEVVKLPVDERAAYAMMGEGGQPSAARALAEIDEYGDDLGVKQHLEELLANPARIEFPKPSQGHLYEVDIPDETINKMLDWDAPLGEQPELVGKVLRGDEMWKDYISQLPPKARKIADEMLVGVRPVTGDASEASWKELDRLAPNIDHNMIHDIHQRNGLSDFNQSGSDLYGGLSYRYGGKEAASQALNEAGIPGIRFYDGSSRKTGRAWQEGLPEGWSYYKGKTGVGIKDDKGLIQTSDFASQKDAHQHLFGLKPTRNIVVFSPDDIRKVKRDGELVYDQTKALNQVAK